MENLKKYISEICDFPKVGINFMDINPIYREPMIWKKVMAPLEKIINNINPDLIAGIESRGFITAAALAYKLEKGLLSIRKPNKLPGNVIGLDYKLEYGEDRLEIQPDLITNGSRIIIIDDLLATGGTASTAGKLIKRAGGNLIGYCFIVELTKLCGRNKLEEELIVESVIKY